RVVRLIQGPLAPIACATRSDAETCPMELGCSLQATWSAVRDATIAILDETTFADLAARAGGRWTEPVPETVGVPSGRPVATRAWRLGGGVPTLRYRSRPHGAGVQRRAGRPARRRAVGPGARVPDEPRARRRRGRRGARGALEADGRAGMAGPDRARGARRP